MSKLCFKMIIVIEVKISNNYRPSIEIELLFLDKLNLIKMQAKIFNLNKMKLYHFSTQKIMSRQVLRTQTIT